MRTIDWRETPKKITLRKLAIEVAKLVQRFVEVGPNILINRTTRSLTSFTGNARKAD